MHAAAVGEVRGPTLGVVEDIAALRSRLAEAELNVAEVPTLCRRYEARLADLEAERALIVARAENAEAALVEAEAKIAELRDALGCEMDDTRNACAAVNAEIDRVNKRLAEAERNEGTLLGMIRHQRDVLRECLPYINESMAGRRPGRCADDIRAAVKALTADSGDERNG
jgi:chromosome segregation ATPase